MLLIKTFGCIIVLTSCTMIGYCMKSRIELKLNNLSNMLSCVQFFETEIRYNMSDILSLFEKVGNIAKGINSELFEKLIINHNSKSDTPLSTIWLQTVQETCTKSNYGNDDKEIISRFGNVLGSGDVDTQLKNLDIFQKNIESRIKEYEKKNGQDCKLYSKAGIYIGIVIVILLI